MTQSTENRQEKAIVPQNNEIKSKIKSDMKISELIKKLQKVQEEHGDVEVLAIENTWGEGDWASLEDSGVIFYRYKKGLII